MYPLIYFARHGNTDFNAEGRLQGQVDTDINALGRRQADTNGRALAALVPNPEQFDFVASPLKRTRETMERIRTVMGLSPYDYRTDARLKELHFGEWQRYTYAELEAREPGITARRAADKWRFVPPGAEAESYEMLAARVKPWLDEVRMQTVCVCHGGIVRALFRLVEDMPGEQAASMDVPQDRILRLQDGRLAWM